MLGVSLECRRNDLQPRPWLPSLPAVDVQNTPPTGVRDDLTPKPRIPLPKQMNAKSDALVSFDSLENRFQQDDLNSMPPSPFRRKRPLGSFITVAASQRRPPPRYRERIRHAPPRPLNYRALLRERVWTTADPLRNHQRPILPWVLIPLQDPYLSASTPGGNQVRASGCAMALSVASASGGGLLGPNGRSTLVCLAAIPSHPSLRVPFRRRALRLPIRAKRRPPPACPLAPGPRAWRALLRALHPECHR
jgi:hypothetical protein